MEELLFYAHTEEFLRLHRGNKQYDGRMQRKRTLCGEIVILFSEKWFFDAKSTQTCNISM